MSKTDLSINWKRAPDLQTNLKSRGGNMVISKWQRAILLDEMAGENLELAILMKEPTPEVR